MLDFAMLYSINSVVLAVVAQATVVTQASMCLVKTQATVMPGCHVMVRLPRDESVIKSRSQATA
jgi:hypothetical protein